MRKIKEIIIMKEGTISSPPPTTKETPLPRQLYQEDVISVNLFYKQCLKINVNVVTQERLLSHCFLPTKCTGRFDLTLSVCVDVSVWQKSGQSSTPSLIGKSRLSQASIGSLMNTLHLAKWRKPNATGQYAGLPSLRGEYVNTRLCRNRSSV